MTNQTWDLDALTSDQRELLGEHLCQTNEGTIFLDPLEPAPRMLTAARQLAKLGLVELDEPRDGFVAEIGVALTPEGEAWILSLPEGALAAR